MLAENVAEGLANLLCIDRHPIFPKLVNLVRVQLHKINVWVLLTHLKHIIDDLVVIINTVDILEEILKDRAGRRDGLVDEKRPTEVNACLQKVISAEMVLRIRTLVISTKR